MFDQRRPGPRPQSGVESTVDTCLSQYDLWPLENGKKKAMAMLDESLIKNEPKSLDKLVHKVDHQNWFVRMKLTRKALLQYIIRAACL